MNTRATLKTKNSTSTTLVRTETSSFWVATALMGITALAPVVIWGITGTTLFISMGVAIVGGALLSLID